MNSLIVYSLFIVLTIIFFAGACIIVRNEITIRKFTRATRRKVKELSRIDLTITKVQIQNNFNVILSRPAFKIPGTENKRSFPLLIQSNSGSIDYEE